MVLFSISAKAFELDPICHQLYGLFQMPDLTYEDVGKIADRMHQNNCWPAMQGPHTRHVKCTASHHRLRFVADGCVGLR